MEKITCENLRNLRKQKKITQEELATILNTTQRTYSGYEIGRSEPNIETLCKLADYYGVSLDYLIGRDFANDFIYLSDYEKNLITQTRKLNDLNKIKILAEIQGMLIVQD